MWGRVDAVLSRRRRWSIALSIVFRASAPETLTRSGAIRCPLPPRGREGCPGRTRRFAFLPVPAVTRRGKPVLAIMTWEDYQAILETLEVLGDDEAMDQLRRSIREVKEGKAIPWKEAKARISA